MRHRNIASFVLANALSVMVGAAASAEERSLGPGAPPLAIARYEAGIARYRAGNYAAAASEFRIALSAMPGSAILAYNLAKAEERSQQWEASIEAYTRYLELAPLAEDRAEVQTIVGSLKTTLDRVKPFIDIETTPPGATLLVDGAEAGASPVKLRVSMGRHDIVASTAGHVAARQRIELAPDGPRKFRLALVPATAAPVAVAEAQTLEPATRRILAWTAVGVGAAALGFGVHQTMQAADAADRGANPRAGDAARQARLREDLDAAQLGMGLGYGVGFACAAAGVALFLWPDASSDPGVAATAEGLILGGRF